VLKELNVKATLVLWATHERVGGGSPQRYVFTYFGEDIPEARRKAANKVTQMKANGCTVIRKTVTLVKI